MQQSTEDPMFLADVLFIDDLCFAGTGVTSIQNGQEKILVRLDLIISSDSFSKRLWASYFNGSYHHNFLLTHFSRLLKRASFNTCLHIWLRRNDVLSTLQS
jgi:hypothetical protein